MMRVAVCAMVCATSFELCALRWVPGWNTYLILCTETVRVPMLDVCDVRRPNNIVICDGALPAGRPAHVRILLAALYFTFI